MRCVRPPTMRSSALKRQWPLRRKQVQTRRYALLLLLLLLLLLCFLNIIYDGAEKERADLMKLLARNSYIQRDAKLVLVPKDDEAVAADVAAQQVEAQERAKVTMILSLSLCGSIDVIMITRVVVAIVAEHCARARVVSSGAS